MSNGVLQFSLGLATSQFIAGVNQSNQSLGGLMTKVGAFGSMLAGLAGFSGAIGKIFDTYERGADLYNLSKRTNETVGNLYRMESGFAAVGLQGDAVGGKILALQKALGGVNEMGEPTGKIFEQMGLSIDGLRQMSAPNQITAISRALNSLDNESAAFAASKIFGRAGAGDMLQLARQTEGFAEAMKRAGGMAGMFQRNAEAFERIDSAIGRLRSKGSQFFAGIAEAIAPALEGLLKVMNQWDAFGWGQKVGKVMSAFGMAIQEGRFWELFEAGLFAAIEKGANFFVQAFSAAAAGLGFALAYVFTEAPKLLEKGMDATFGKLKVLFGNWIAEHQLAEIWSKPGPKTKEEMKQLQEYLRMKGIMLDKNTAQVSVVENAVKTFGSDMLRFVAGAQVAQWKGIASGFQGKDGFFGNSLSEEFQKKLDAFAARARQITKPDPAEEKKKLDIDEKLAKSKPEVNALERIGAIFGGGQTAVDYAQRTADNTGALVRTLGEHSRLLADIRGGILSNRGGGSLLNA